MPDLRDATLAQDFDALLAHLAANAAAFGADRERIAVYAGSGNVYRGLPLFVDPRRTAIKALVLYYGSADVKTFRGDLPTLFVRAGLDRPPVTRAMTNLITLAQSQNVPVTVINYPGGHHAFEMLDDEPAIRDVIDATLACVVRSTAPAFQASIRRGLPEATAAAQVAAGEFAAACSVFDQLRNKGLGPRALAADPIFAPIRERADFKALFEGGR
jgi:acetyl esterase/lipase